MAAILGRVYSIQEHGPGTKAKKKEQTRMYRPCQLDALQCVVSILIAGMDEVGKTKKTEQTRMYKPCQLDAVQCVVSILITGMDGIGKTKKKKQEKTAQVSW